MTTTNATDTSASATEANAVQWDSKQYLRFKNERTQPSRDLAAQLPPDDGTVRRVLDIGCGPGNSTAVLRERYPHAEILGVDNSPEMIAAARESHPDIDFAPFDASNPADFDALPHDFDVVFSNACIQWVPDHPRLIPAMLGLLRPGGMLAVQTPMNYEEPIHRIIADVVHSPRYADRLAQGREFFNLTPPEYWELLHGGELVADFRIWKVVYMHNLPSHEAIMDWYRGTGLRPYLQTLPGDAERKAFENEIFGRVREAYPPQSDGSIIFPFPRFFFTAVRG
ncbi:methyltransferase domain-containing protein [Bifidobacterium sp. SMB2]|uniref:Methyltransferase domain-containing protein n=1 Tax=Bifidobacterium saimiriisciurei TaxID=2661627 RepID=A0ABX0CF53_9BIFI|nr:MULTISPECIES: methyltransferase domain-containing protein [Bifidobacterium]NEG96617.1 methyltransferase domain-containing protein [Bifidobacterium sp. SMB2]NEH12400.1 methyltransferase domain-containing protein [Bifidobacterium saimiriisciurei]